MLLTFVPGFALQDCSCRIWHQGLAGGPSNPTASWIYKAVCNVTSSV